MRPPQLVLLDACGVILNDPLPELLIALASAIDVPHAEVMRRYADLRLPFWTGRLGEIPFWECLTGGVDAPGWASRLASSFRPGPAAPALGAWATRARLRVLSNHRSEWLVPRLMAMDLARHFERVVVSDAIDAAKPSPEAFLRALSDAAVAPGDVLFVDDKRVNVEAARSLGLEALHAKPGTGWVDAVSARLGLAPLDAAG